MEPRLSFDCTHYVRRPAGLVVSWEDERGAPRRDLGSYFAACACLEAASVLAFVRLASDLRSLGAPPHLVAQAERAQEDEMRHAEQAMRLARQFEKCPATFSINTERPRSRTAIARENAVEGCVREAYGAAAALWQARTAKGADVREAFAVMAGNKLRHVDLAWSIDEWLSPKLDAKELANVHDARTTALADLWDELTTPIAPLLVNVAGVPTMDAALFLFDDLEERLHGRRAA